MMNLILQSYAASTYAQFVNFLNPFFKEAQLFTIAGGKYVVADVPTASAAIIKANNAKGVLLNGA